MDETVEMVQYIYDHSGHKTGVIVPIDLWEKIIYEQTPHMGKPEFDPKKFRGIMKGRGINSELVAKSLRDEWVRM